MKLMSTVLIDSFKTRKQIVGSYLRIHPKTRKINGYCALGTLFCEAGEVDELGCVKTSTNELLSDSYGISMNKQHTKSFCPECDRETNYLTGLMIHLNDTHAWDFKRIGEHMKEMGF